jgi:hypothetical protein
MPRKIRNWRGTAFQNVILEKFSRQLIQDARRKAHGQGVTFRQQVINLLTAWTYAEENVAFENEDEM